MTRFLCALAAAGIALVGSAGMSAPAVVDRNGAALGPRVTAQLISLGVGGTTTLDARIQRAADRALDLGLTEARAQGLFPTGGAAVVVGLEEKALLAIASAPEPDRSRTLAAVPAGSVVKPIVAVAAIGEGLDASEPRPCPARFEAGGATIRNWRSRDRSPLTLPEAIADSCNTVFASLAAALWDLGADPAAGASRAAPAAGASHADPAAGADPRADPRTAIARAYRRFGFGVPTGLIPGEQPGRLPGPSPTVGDLMVLAIGQGPLTVTPLQVALAFASIAGATPDEWNTLSGRAAPSRITSSDERLLDPVREGLVAAVRDGTARESFDDVALDRLPVAGKTGSAEIGDATPYGWFAAYAPATSPRYVVAVVVERGRAGAISAAPVARRILDAILDLPRVPPPLPLPHPAILLLAMPLAAALASPAAGSLAGLATGSLAGAIAGGSVAANALAFAAAGWLAGMSVLRGASRLWFALAAAVGTLALPATGRPLWWITARAGVAAAATVAAIFLSANRPSPRNRGSGRAGAKHLD